MASFAPSDDRAPALRHLFREGGSLLSLHARSMMPGRPAARRVGAGQPVMVIPGFLATDWSTVIMRRALDAAGYRALGWGLGVNLGARSDLLERMEGQLGKAASDGPVSLVGWSLGGIYARELAKRRPEQVSRVITLGSPFSGDVRANNAWRLYELLNDHKVDAPPIDARIGEKPPVPTIAMWSRKDGIVAPLCARGEPHESDRSIELDCTHMGFMSAACAMQAVLDALGD